MTTPKNQTTPESQGTPEKPQQWLMSKFTSYFSGKVNDVIDFIANNPLSNRITTEVKNISDMADFFLDKDKITSFVSNFKVVIAWLSLLWVIQLNSNDINGLASDVGYQVNSLQNNVFGTNLPISRQDELSVVYAESKKWFESNPNFYNNPKFQEQHFKNLVELENSKTKWTKLLQSIILWILYGYAYMKTIRRVKNEGLKIDTTSFLTFSLTSWAMVLVNWFVPWSVVYFESFILALWAVLLHGKNEYSRSTES